MLNPNKPGCAELRKRQELARKDLDKTLPDKLSQTDVRKGISAVKSNAKSCGSKHGVPAGTKVRVKLSIAGDTGKVISADPLAPHAGTAVGSCVANAVKQASFRRFKSGQQGATYPFTM